MSESEAIDVLSRDANVMAAISSERFGAYTARLPDSVWVRLKRSLSPLLVEKGIEGEPLISFFHRQVTKVVQHRIYEPEKVPLHRALAVHFDPRASENELDPRWTRRCFAELPFQLFNSGERARLDALLTDPAWIDKKIREYRGVHEITEDLRSFGNPAALDQNLVLDALQLSAGILSRSPIQAMAQLHGRLLEVATESFLRRLYERIPTGGLYEMLPTLTPPGGPEFVRIEGHESVVKTLATLPDGRLASGSDDRTIRIWDLVTQIEAARFEGHEGPINALAVLPDGRLSSGSDDRTIRIWDLVTQIEAARFEGHEGPINALGVLPDGRLASGSDDNFVKLWDIDKVQRGENLGCHERSIIALIALPDGTVTTGGRNQTIMCWVSSRTSIDYDGHTDDVMAFAMLPDGRLASASRDRTIRIWRRGSKRERVSSSIFEITELPDGRIASCSVQPEIVLWDPLTGKQVDQCNIPIDYANAIESFPDGRIICGGPLGIVHLWDPQTRTMNRNARHPEPPAWIHALATLPDGRVAIATHRDIRLLNCSTFAETWLVAAHDGDVMALAVLPDGRLTSYSHFDDTIRIWDSAVGEEVSRIQGNCPHPRHNGYLRDALAVLPDGRLVTGSPDHAIRIWDAANGGSAARLVGHRSWITAFAALPNNRLASSSADMTVRIWDLTSQSEITQLEIDCPIFDLIALSDGRLLAADQLGWLHRLAIKTAGATPAVSGL